MWKKKFALHTCNGKNEECHNMYIYTKFINGNSVTSGTFNFLISKLVLGIYSMRKDNKTMKGFIEPFFLLILRKGGIIQHYYKCKSILAKNYSLTLLPPLLWSVYPLWLWKISLVLESF